MMLFHRFLVAVVFAGCLMVYGMPAAADQTILVDFSTGILNVVDANGVVQFSTPVVLPRREFYSVPVSGVVTSASMGPTWAPTANTRAAHPGRYKASYGPYEPGNAMGHCKITIDFASDDPILRTVRIHGNAKAADLGGRYSRGCIRIPDAVCAIVTSLVNVESGVTSVQFTE
jgi:lipoprotein-anchoring transpeptidase ErfK/SrfK